MRRATVLAIMGLAPACAVRASRAPDANVTSFVGVDVIPMDRDTILSDQTVIVRHGRIVALGPARHLQAPRTAQIIDGRGRYLLPGLTDFHTHLQTRGDMLLYVAHGVTTVVDLGSFVAERLLAWRDSTRAGQLLGPAIFTSLFTDGSRGVPSMFPGEFAGLATVDTRAQARDAVRRARGNGFDFIKLYNSIPDSALFALAEEARAMRVPLIGHGVRSVGMERALAAGQRLVVHGEEYLYTFFGDELDTTRIPPAIAFTKRNGAYVIPNLSAFSEIARQWSNRARLDSILARPEVQSLDSTWRERWAGSDYVNRKGSVAPQMAFLRTFTKALSDSGVPMLLGTDSPMIPGLFPGSSLHLDMDRLLDAGLTPYQVLVAGTRAPGAFIARELPDAERFGTIAPGVRADLLLLDSNPLQNLAALERPLGVMVRGRWLPRAKLDSLVRSLVPTSALPR